MTAQEERWQKKVANTNEKYSRKIAELESTYNFFSNIEKIISEYMEEGLTREQAVKKFCKENEEARKKKELKLKKRRLYYTLPNGKYHSFLSNKNHKYAVASVSKDTELGFCYTDDYAKAKTTAANWTNKFNNAEEGFRWFVVVDVQEVE